MTKIELSDHSDEVLINNVIRLEKMATKVRYLYFTSAVILGLIAVYWLVVFSVVVVPNFVLSYTTIKFN